MILLLVPLAVLAVVIGTNFGWQWVFAPLLGLLLLRWLLGSLRALGPGANAPGLEPDAGPARPVADGERTLYWCEECGAEVLLLLRGTSRAPTHCGQRMHERTELTN